MNAMLCVVNHNFYIGSTIRPVHIRIKEHLNTCASSFHKRLIKYKNNDNFSIKIEAIVRNVGNLKIKEALLIAKLHLISKLELNIEYIINKNIFKYISKFQKKRKLKSCLFHMAFKHSTWPHGCNT